MSLALVRGIHQWLVNSPQKGPVMRKMFPFDDVIMKSTSTRPWDTTNQHSKQPWEAWLSIRHQSDTFILYRCLININPRAFDYLGYVWSILVLTHPIITWHCKKHSKSTGGTQMNWGVLCQKQVSRAGTSNYIPQILWDVITCPCPWYLLLAQHSSIVLFHNYFFP